MNPQIDSLTDPVRDFLKTANERTTELADRLSKRFRTLEQNSEKLTRETVERSQTLLDDALDRTRSTALNWERSVLLGVEKALGQACDKAPKAEFLGRALERISNLRDEADMRAAAGGAITLPIDDYDQLTAKAIVKALDSLEADALSLIAAYEGAHKNRKTILRACKS